MNGAAWIFAWIIYLIVALGAAGLFTRIKESWIGPWLTLVMLVGSLALFIMTWSLREGAVSTIALPHPWPTLVAAPLPLAGLWSWIAGLLFFSAALLTMRRPDAHRVFYALIPLVAAVGVYLWSGDGILLLVSWEFISAVTYLGLVTTRRARPVWNAGWTLLALSELGGMLLLISLVWLMPAGTPFLHDALTQLRQSGLHHSILVTNSIMILAMVAFGVKAGLFPVMIWMPMAEPEAPGVVAGIFSGLLTALAVSGILAMIKLAGSGMAWAIVLLVLGVLGALSGALYSVVSRHVKRVLAYSTLEILGLVFAAIAVWRITSLTQPINAASSLALDAAVILLVMHAGAKFVLFGVTDYTGLWSHTLDGLGGLLRQSGPAGFLSLGAVLTLGAFPPLGGFVGEWLLLEAILKPLDGTATAAAHVALMVAGAVLALTVAVGVAAYLRWFGFIFLGPYRGSKAIQARPLTSWLVGLALPMALVIVAGPGIPWFLPRVNRALGAFLTSKSPVVAPTFLHPGTAAPLLPIGVNLIPAPGAAGTVFFPQAFNVGDPYVLLWMALCLSIIVAIIRRWSRRRAVRLVNPWNGGAEPFSGRTSWSAEGFVHPVRLAFARFYGLARTRSQREGAHFYRHTMIYRLEEQAYRPLMALGVWAAGWVRRIQSGRINQYVTYVWAVALLAIVISIIR